MSPAVATKKNRAFDPDRFLATIGQGRKSLTVAKRKRIFTQGDAADAVFYIQKGKVRLSVVSKTGKEATIGILSEENFLAKARLAGQALRMGSATAMTDCQLLRIEKKAMMDALHSRTCLVRHVRGVFAGAQYPLRRRPGRPTVSIPAKRDWPVSF